jgi:flagellar P-ring protein precursor FlgI
MIGIVLLTASLAGAERIKDITSIAGIRGNPLRGYGLVIGLDQTGDDSEVSRRVMASILRRLSNINVDVDDISSKSIASVLVTAELPPFGRKGSSLDVTVSIIGNATSLQGGVLHMTPLKGADGEVYAVAQRPLTIGGFGARGENASVTRNHLTVAHVANAATVEREEIAEFVVNGEMKFLLTNPDFTTADRIATAINQLYPGAADALDSGTIRVRLPGDLKQRELAAFIDRVGALNVTVDQPAVVVINERTGTIIVGQHVGISTVGIAHGNLSIVIQEKDFVSQPRPFSNTGDTQTISRTEAEVREEEAPIIVIGQKANVADLARALNAMGLSPRDIIAIFQALKQAGALQAELKVI